MLRNPEKSPSIRPLRHHAELVSEISGWAVAGAAVAFLLSFPFAPFSLRYCLIALSIGVGTFPLLWQHWRRPSVPLLIAIIIPVVFGRSLGEMVCFLSPVKASWLLLVQFVSLILVGQFTLVHLFRRRIVQSVRID